MKCKVYSKKIERNSQTYRCKCGHKCHKACSGINISVLKTDFQAKWLCTACIAVNLPFNHIADEIDFRNTLQNFFVNEHDATVPVLNNTMPDIFQLNCTNDHLDDSLTNCDAPCQYYFTDSLNCKLSDLQCKDSLSMFHLNVQSLPAKFENVETFLESINCNFTVYAFSETWLSDDVPSYYNLPNYTFLNKCRKGRRGGGVCMYVNSDVMYKKRYDHTLDKDSIDSLFIEIEVKDHRNVIIGVIYKPPNFNSSDFIDSLSTILSRIESEQKDCFLLGDYNFDLMKYSTHGDTESFLNTLNTYCYRPLITKPTRVTTRTGTCIDNIFSNVLSDPILPGILYTDISDHFPIFSIIQKKINLRPQKKPSNYPRVNVSALKADLSNEDFTDVMNSNDVNVSYDRFMNILSEKCKKHTVMVHSYKKKNVPRKPWITPGIIRSMNRRDKLFAKYRKTNSPTDKLKYNELRNRVIRIQRVSKSAYMAKRLATYKNDLQKTWKILNGIIGKKKLPTLPSYVMRENLKQTSDESIANRFNSFFGNIGLEISRKVKSTSNHFSNYLPDRVNKSLFLEPTDEKEILSITRNLKSSFSSGIDGLSSNLIRQIIPSIAKPFTHICNNSFLNGSFPEGMKLSKVIPIFKNGDPNCVNNYRPISLLPTLSKVLERLMFNRLYKYLSVNDLINKQQFGFRPGHSTELALIHAVEQLNSFIEDKCASLAIYIDLSKAFDALNHEILLYKLNVYGVRGHALQWFTSYLSNRKQLVKVNDCNSDYVTINTGVPQGSILGPLLFLIYVNDLTRSSQIASFILYADDTNLFFSDKDVNSLIQKANTELEKVCHWFRANMLQLNSSKTKFMVFNRGKPLDRNVELKIDQEPIIKVDSVNFLGVILDDQLSWDKHILHITTKVSRNIGIMSKVRSFLPEHILRVLYCTLILPFFDYCNIIWGRARQKRMNRLFLLQKRAIRLCAGAHFRAHTHNLFQQLNVLPLDKLIDFKTGIFMHKFKNDFLPDTFSNYFVKLSQPHVQNTRNVNLYRLPLFKSTFSQRQSIQFNGAKLWNNLPVTIQNSTSLTHFKKLLKSVLSFAVPRL